MTIIIRPCFFCKHMGRPLSTKCKAFPDGIPIEIIKGKVFHDSPYPGDHGIQFEPFATGPEMDEFIKLFKDQDLGGDEDNAI